MRRTLLLFQLLSLLLLYVPAAAQNIRLSVKEAQLPVVFRQLQQQTPYRFIYSNEVLKGTQPVTLTVQAQELEDVLPLLFRNQPLAYTIEDHFVVIRRKEMPPATSPATIVQNNISGIVTNEQGEPLAGATVNVKGTNKATATNRQGAFTLEDVPPNAVLTVSSVGYIPQEVVLGKKHNINIVLQLSANTLDETVVIAYGTTTRRLNTGSVGRVTAEEISKQPVSNPLAALQGRVPGLFITQGNGLPGSNFTVQIRGRNSIQQGNDPLYIIDGVPFPSDKLVQRNSLNANSPFNSLNPADIESIEILKDADATAIYGSRGANGVVLITTKKGKVGKTSLSMNIYNGWGRITRAMNYLNTKQYISMRRQAFINDGVLPTLSNAYDLLAWDTTRYTDWKKLLIGGTAHTTNAFARLTGGNSTTRFSFSTNYYRETTVFPGDMADQRSSASLNVIHNTPDSRLNLSMSASYAVDRSNLLPQDLTQFTKLPPNAPQLYDSLGRLNWSEGSFTFSNPLSYLFQQYKGVTERLTSNAVVTARLLPSLIWRTNFGYNNLHFDEITTTPVDAQNPAFNPKGSATFGNNALKNWIIEPQFEYTLPVGKSKLLFLIGSSWQERKGSSNLISGAGYTNDALLESIAGAATTTASNAYNLYRYSAFFGRVHYNWANRYLLNITARRDGSSRFGTSRQWANFGAIGGAWIFTETKGLKEKLPLLSYGKIRGSYGVTGNDQIGNYQYLDTWTATSFPYSGQPALRPTRLSNADYSWERNKKIEVALELGLLKDRIFFSGDWFQNRSDNQLISYLLPSQTGFSSMVLNFPGMIQNRGYEFELRSTNLKHKDWNWTTGWNITIARNKLLAFPGLAASSYATTYAIGHPLNTKMGYHFLGVDPQSGVYQFEDINKDGAINTKDYTALGTTDPRFYGGLQNDVSYKGWQLSVFFQFVKQLGLHPVYSIFSRPGEAVNQPEIILDHWQKTGDVVPYQKYTQAFGTAASNASLLIYASDAALTDASFIRLKNVSLSYTFPDRWIKKKMSKVCFYVQGQNIYTFTRYDGFDPENQSLTSLPPLKMLTMGLQLIF